jgi:hypothetical protein
MAYQITKTNDYLLGTIADGTIDSPTVGGSLTSLTLIGRNYSNYGELMANNMVALVENFSLDTAPANPLVGQLWWDSANRLLKLYANTTNDTDTGPAIWKNVGGATSSTTGPTTTTAGDLWWDSSNKQLYAYDGTTPYALAGWILIGPGFRNSLGRSGAIWEQITDTVAVPHNVVSLYLDGVRTAIISKDSEFQPNVAIVGFGNVQAGYNMSTAYTIYGTANNASYLGTQPAANYFRNNINNTGTGTLTVVNDSGITVGAGGDLTFNVSGIHSRIINNSNGGNVELYANVGGTSSKYISINGSTGAVEVAAQPTTTLGVATKGYVDDAFVDATLTGVSTAITAPFGTANTMIATTAFVINNSGFFTNKIYQGNSYLEILDTGSNGEANLVLDGRSIMTAASGGVYLQNGATAITQTQTFNGAGNATIATTQYVKSATTWWGGSAKFVSADAPNAGVNDAGSNNGDFWFQYTT